MKKGMGDLYKLFWIRHSGAQSTLLSLEMSSTSEVHKCPTIEHKNIIENWQLSRKNANAIVPGNKMYISWIQQF